MTNKDVERKMYEDFSLAELQKLGEKSVTTVTAMAKSDRVIIEDELLDYLRDFFNDIYDGEPIPMVFTSSLIEWRTQNGLVRMYVTFPEDKQDWVYIDTFFGWKFLGKLIFPNVKMDDSERNEEGRFFTFTPFLTVENFPQDFLATLVPAVKDIFTYAYLYVQANKEVKHLFKEEKVKTSTVASAAKSQKKSGSKKKKHEPNVGGRDKVYVPSRRVYTVRKTEETVRNLCEYIYSRWKVRGYSYTRKDGKKVNVKEHYAFRHLPNKGIDKEGTDFILRKADDLN